MLGMANKRNAKRDSVKADYGMMRIDAPYAGARYVAWARVLGETVFTTVRESYTDARGELSAVAGKLGWVPYYFDGETLHQMERM